MSEDFKNSDIGQIDNKNELIIYSTIVTKKRYCHEKKKSETWYVLVADVNGWEMYMDTSRDKVIEWVNDANKMYGYERIKLS